MGTIPYAKAIRRIYSLEKFGMRLGLERISALLSALGDPQKSYRCVLVAGSNGKGSTTEFIGSCLSSSGLRVGTYFSPQIQQFQERFRINGKNASKREIAFAYAKVEEACRKNGIHATFFEVVTAMAFLIFKSRKVDYAVLEVGLGGRLDATNACEPCLSALTSISLEHTDILGKTIGSIAHEKCGVARKGKPLVCGFLSDEAKEAVRKECAKIGALPLFADQEVELLSLSKKGLQSSFSASFRGKAYRISLSAPGDFQISNACAALAAAALLGAPKRAIEEGLSKCRPKFRLQEVSKNPFVIADCAHNPEAASALAKEVQKLPFGKKVLLFSAMSDKDYGEALRILSPHFSSLVLCEVSVARSASLPSLFSKAQPHFSSIRMIRQARLAFSQAKKIAGKQGLVVVAGSIYLLGELFGKEKIRLSQ
ncbi:MAG: bifunctional folylpolyglutamate synthase/dihydrofolate synthase [Candidatus Micrarchaeota archaeon]|nr:bifunctional folylpolyglutamate synthase/dihydrofolate synthase [Candidatus Micrarchaeota archaeon]